MIAITKQTNKEPRILTGRKTVGTCKGVRISADNIHFYGKSDGDVNHSLGKTCEINDKLSKVENHE